MADWTPKQNAAYKFSSGETVGGKLPNLATLTTF